MPRIGIGIDGERWRLDLKVDLSACEFDGTLEKAEAEAEGEGEAKWHGKEMPEVSQPWGMCDHLTSNSGSFLDWLHHVRCSSHLTTSIFLEDDEENTMAWSTCLVHWFQIVP